MAKRLEFPSCILILSLIARTSNKDSVETRYFGIVRKTALARLTQIRSRRR